MALDLIVSKISGLLQSFALIIIGITNPIVSQGLSAGIVPLLFSRVVDRLKNDGNGVIRGSQSF